MISHILLFQACSSGIRNESVPCLSRTIRVVFDVQVAFGKRLPYTNFKQKFKPSSKFEIVAPEPNSVPPYVPYRTFRTFLESLTISMPDRIDRSVFDSKFSGTATSQITSALRALKLIDAEGSPRQALVQLVRTEGEQRHQILENILKSYYTPVFNLDLQRATKAQFREAMREFGCTPSMLIKCETFFIHAATHAGIPLSPYLKSNRKTSSRSRSSSRSAKTSGQSSSADEANDVAAVDLHSASLTMGELALRVLDKYPKFDPTWPEETQTSWMDGMKKLQDTFNLPNLPAK